MSLTLLPASNPKLSGLPNNLGIEFLDLPGIKSIQDRTNLSIIQPLVGGAFSLVALDYLQVDEEHRQTLLNELTKVVNSLHGRTDSMIFILNRVDNRGSDDLPIKVRLEKLKKEIKETLCLSQLPDIIPFNARLLYYAQCAWGTNSLDTKSDTSQDIRRDRLKFLFKDCHSTIEDYTEDDWEVQDWLELVKKSIKRGEEINDKDIKELVRLALQWSGGQSLWSSIRQRLEKSFSELIILPILNNVLNNYNSLSSSVRGFIQTSQITDPEVIIKKQKQLKEFRQDLPILTNKLRNSFENEIKDYIGAFKNGDKDRISQVLNDLSTKGITGFQVIFDSINDIEADLNESIIAIIRDAFNNKLGTYDLQESLQEYISPALATDIAREYDHVKGRLVDFSSDHNNLEKSVRSNDARKVKELEHDEKYVRLLYQVVKNGITARAEFSLQVKEAELIPALKSLIFHNLERLKLIVPDEIINCFNINQVIDNDIVKNLEGDFTRLPDHLFNFDVHIKQGSSQQKEKVATTKQARTREVGSCLNKKTETYYEYVDKYENIVYKKLSIPNPQNMAKQWSGGVQIGKEKLWDLLMEWTTEKLDVANNVFSQSLNRMIDMIERILDEKYNELSDALSTQKIITKLSIALDKCDDTCQIFVNSLTSKED
ncbi:hypothetical protein NON20_19065 [Synechocystis sp. B12]|nr:hypothetical protein NON20_19065 [Synechocystis sp. B12]